jgi:hypothetical protein
VDNNDLSETDKERLRVLIELEQSMGLSGTNWHTIARLLKLSVLSVKRAGEAIIQAASDVGSGTRCEQPHETLPRLHDNANAIDQDEETNDPQRSSAIIQAASDVGSGTRCEQPHETLPRLHDNANAIDQDEETNNPQRSSTSVGHIAASSTDDQNVTTENGGEGRPATATNTKLATHAGAILTSKKHDPSHGPSFSFEPPPSAPPADTI